MGNLSRPLEKILKNARKKQRLEMNLRSVFPGRQARHIKKTAIYKNRLIVYLDSAAALYEFNLTRDKALKRLQDKNIACSDLVFKIGT